MGDQLLLRWLIASGGREGRCASVVFVWGSFLIDGITILQINSFDKCNPHTSHKSSPSVWVLDKAWSNKDRSTFVHQSNLQREVPFDQMPCKTLFCPETTTWETCFFHQHGNEIQILNQKVFISGLGIFWCFMLKQCKEMLFELFWNHCSVE